MIGREGGLEAPCLALGVPELIFILLLALLIFGPKRLPEIGRTLGKGMSEFRKASNELTRSINTELASGRDPRRRRRCADATGWKRSARRVAAYAPYALPLSEPRRPPRARTTARGQPSNTPIEPS